MSISGALSSAMQGLRAAGRGSEVIAANLSNVLTPGYGVRSLELSSDTKASFTTNASQKRDKQMHPQF